MQNAIKDKKNESKQGRKLITSSDVIDCKWLINFVCFSLLKNYQKRYPRSTSDCCHLCCLILILIPSGHNNHTSLECFVCNDLPNEWYYPRQEVE